MRKIWILACTYLLVSAASFAQLPSQSLTKEALAAILGQSSAASASCAPKPSRELFAAKDSLIRLGVVTTVVVSNAVDATNLTNSCDSLSGREKSCCLCDLDGDCLHCCRCETGLPLTACVYRCP